MGIASGERRPPEVRTLRNGIRVILDVDKGHPTAAVGALVASGSRFEGDRNRGISHFIEHVVFKGTEHRTALEISSSIENVGGELNAFTDTQYTMFYMRVPSTHTGLALDVLGDILLHPLMDSASVELERKVIEQEILAFQDSPDDVVSDELLKLVFGNDPVAANPLGTLESVKSLTRADLLDYYRQRFNGSGLVLSIAGDVDTAEVLQLAEKTFGTLPVGEALPTWGEPSRNCGRVVTERPTEQIYLAMALPGFAQYSRQSSVLNLVSSIFGGNMSSRLFQRAREKEALVYSIGSFPMTFSNTGILGVSASSSPQNADRVQEVIMDEIEIMRHDKISMVELQHAKDGILGGFLLSLESFFRRMHRNAGELYMRGTIRSVGEIAELVNSITLGEAMEIIDNVFDSSRLAVSVVHGPADS
ncbi:MAG: pitrilysin family protein [Caldisericota bacterium]|jgi:predicted Zn-dependent peptidase|nr:pitrilysin family protein [Caldisericota bacterium]